LCGPAAGAKDPKIVILFNPAPCDAGIHPGIQARDKGSLSAGVSLRALEHDIDILEGLVRGDFKAIEDYVDAASLAAAYEKFRNNPLKSEDEVFSLMLVANLALWLRDSRGLDLAECS
jgi:hypothetical protein